MLPFRLARLSWFLPTALLFTSAAQAMQIQQFDKMAAQDQHNYVNTLIVGAQRVLAHEGGRTGAVW